MSKLTFHSSKDANDYPPIQVGISPSKSDIVVETMPKKTQDIIENPVFLTPNGITRILELCNEPMSRSRLTLVRHLPLKKTPDYEIYRKIKTLKNTKKIDIAQSTKCDSVELSRELDFFHEIINSTEVEGITVKQSEKFGKLLDILIEEFQGKLTKTQFDQLEHILDILDKRIEVIDNPDGKLLNKLNTIFDKQYNNSEIEVYGDSNSNKRSKQTLNWVYRKFGLTATRIDLPTRERTGDYHDSLINAWEKLTKVVNETISTKVGETFGGKTIVIIGNRSYSHFFNIIGGERYSSLEDDATTLKEMGYLYFDFDIHGKPIQENDTYLTVTPENYHEIKNLFEIPKGSNTPSILQLQEGLNKYFTENPNLYEKYLRREDSNDGIRAFCLANLIIQKDYNIIENYYSSPECISLSKEEKRLLLQNIKDEKIMKIFKRLFVCRSNLWKDEEGKLFEDELQSKFYIFLKQSRLAYNTAIGLQSNSLDPLIKTGVENAVMDRQLYYEEEDIDKNPNSQNQQNKKKIIQRDFDSDMFLKEGKYSKFIIRAHVGEGKSIYLSELVKQFSLEQDKEVKFEIAKNLKEEDIVNLFSNTQAIVCIDALDEANEKVKNRIKEEFRNFEGRCIITTRKSESFQLDKNTCILYFNPLDSGKYIDSRFGEDITNANKVKEWIEKQGLANEVKGNPLLLNMIVILASVDKDDKEWMKKYKIPEYDKIKTKSDLYENVVRFVLAKHSKDMKGQKCANIDLESWMDQLGEYAYRKFSITNSTPITSDDVEYFDIHLSILFKSEKNEEYNFIHRSFYEYFLARHLAKMENGKGSQAIYTYRDEKMKGNWNDWREFRSVVMFYGEMLVKNERWSELESFLGKDGILKNDDIFGENFFMGLEILLKTENYALMLSAREQFATIVNSYISKVDRVMKIKGATEMMKRCNFQDGTRVIEYMIGIQKEYLRRAEKTAENYLSLARTGDKESIDICFDHCKNIIKNIANGAMCGKFERHEAGDLILQLIEIGSEYTHLQLIKIGLLLIEEDEIKLSIIIFKKIIKSNYREFAIKVMFILANQGNFDDSIELMLEMINQGNPGDYVQVIEYLKILEEVVKERGKNPKIGRAIFFSVCVYLPELYAIGERFNKDRGKTIFFRNIISLIESIGNLELDIGNSWKKFRIRDKWNRNSKKDNIIDNQLTNTDDLYISNSMIKNEIKKYGIENNKADNNPPFSLYLKLAERDVPGSLEEIIKLLDPNALWDEGNLFSYKQLFVLPLEKIQEIIFSLIRRLIGDTSLYGNSMKHAEEFFILLIKHGSSKDELAIFNFWKSLQGNDSVEPGVTEWLNYLSVFDIRISRELINGR